MESSTTDSNKAEICDQSSDPEVKAEKTAESLESPDAELNVENASISPKNDSISISDEDEVKVNFKIIYNKQKYDVTFPIKANVNKLKEHIETIIGVPASMQKLMYKGLAKDDKTLEDLGVVKGAKLMVVGSTLTDILAVSSTPSQESLKEDSASSSTKQPLCKQKPHKKVIDKGIPDDALPGIRNKKECLPPYPISGMVNKTGGKVRLTFKLELDQLWVGTKERTEKLPMNSIKDVISEAIEDHTEYHIMGLQLGPTEASRYWIYWVPAQYVDAIKDAILGKWQIF